MRRAIHHLHPGQVVLLWGLALLGLWAFNSGRLDPALGVEEVRALDVYGSSGPARLDADSLATIVARREDARSAMAELIAADSLALLAALATDDASADDAGGADKPPTSRTEALALPTASPDRHFVLVTPVVDSMWPWPRTIPSRVRQRAVDGEAARVRTELDTYREATTAWDGGRTKVQRSRVVKGFTIALFLVAVGVTWVWFGRPRIEGTAPVGGPSDLPAS